MPNSRAAATRRVAVVLPEFMFGVADIVRGIVRYTQTHPGFKIHDLFFQKPGDVAKKLARGGFHGAITSLMPIDFEDVRPHLPADVKLVNIGTDPLGPGIVRLCSSDKAIVEVVLKHLSDAGFERLAPLGLSASAAWQRRMTLLRQLARPLGVEVAFEWQYAYEDPGEPCSCPALEEWLAKLPARTGVVTCHGYAARCVSDACVKVGRAVPNDIGILSLLDERWCLFGEPAISAVRFAGVKFGFEAMKILDRIFQGRKPPERPREFAPRHIVARRSTRVLQRHSREIANALAFIKENACHGITVKEVLAATQTVSRRKFYSEFEAQVGYAPAEQIRREKIAHAQELLHDSTLTVRRIAELCGFTNVTRFQVQFRQIVGRTPLQFRRRIK